MLKGSCAGPVDLDFCTRIANVGAEGFFLAQAGGVPARLLFAKRSAQLRQGLEPCGLCRLGSLRGLGA